MPPRAEAVTGTPMTGRMVRAATAPARCAAMPAAQMNTRQPSASRSRTSFSVRSGVRCAEATVNRWSMPSLSRTSTQGRMVSSSEMEPMNTATRGMAYLPRPLAPMSLRK